MSLKVANTVKDKILKLQIAFKRHSTDGVKLYGSVSGVIALNDS